MLVVMVHPGPSLTRIVADAVIAGVEEHGNDAELVDLAAEGFDPVFGAADHAAYAAAGSVPADVRREQRRIDRAGHLVLVFPVYWWAMPALLKGWIDRVFIAGWAFDADDEGGIVKKLGRLRVHLVALRGASASTYDRRGYRAAMKAQIEQGIFDFCGARVVTSVLLPSDAAEAADTPSMAVRSVLQGLR